MLRFKFLLVAFVNMTEICCYRTIKFAQLLQGFKSEYKSIT